MSESAVPNDIDVFNLPVFPVADLFPMIREDELSELAEDIRENGQQEPVVIAEVNGTWQLIDGRNRLAACKMAEVIPSHRILTTDPTAYILSANVHRRHLNKGQQAMVTAMAYPEAKRGRGNIDSVKELKINDFSGGYIRQARYVLRNNFTPENQQYPDRCLAVMAGTLALTEAYAKTQEDVKQREEEEHIRQENLAKLTAIRGRYPDIAGLVDDDRITLSDAIAMAASRDFEKAEKERLEQEAKAEKLAQEEKERIEKERQEKEYFEQCLTGFFAQLNNLISGTSVVVNDVQVEALDKYQGQWDRFSQTYHHERKDTLRVLAALHKNLPTLINKLETM